MKRIAFFLLLFIIASSLCIYAEEGKEKKTTVLIAPDLLGIIFGYINVNFEIPFGGGLALEIKPSYFNLKASPILGAVLDPDFQVWAAGASVGANYYFSNNAPNGFFIGIFGNASYAYIGDPAFNVSGIQIGGGAKLGFRWVWDWFSLGPQIGFGWNKYLVDLSAFDETFSAALDGPFYPVSLGIALAF